ncbi:hypothetical protein NQ314_008439, partial [Rhamnusium bicolor]
KLKFGTLLKNGQLDIPGPRLLPNEENGTAMPFILIGDEAFGSSEHLYVRILTEVCHLRNVSLSTGCQEPVEW